MDLVPACMSRRDQEEAKTENQPNCLSDIERLQHTEWCVDVSNLYCLQIYLAAKTNFALEKKRKININKDFSVWGILWDNLSWKINKLRSFF